MAEKEKEQDPRQLIRETVKELIAELGPVFQSIALTPEKLREAQKPYEDPAKLARELHEQESWRRQEVEKEATRKALQESCPHKDKNGKLNISLQHNYHDHMPRGICMVCGIFIHPAYWDYRPVTDEVTGKVQDKGFIVPEHKLYYLVRQLEAYA
jgi:hypothetical protein